MYNAEGYIKRLNGVKDFKDFKNIMTISNNEKAYEKCCELIVYLSDNVKHYDTVNISLLYKLLGFLQLSLNDDSINKNNLIKKVSKNKNLILDIYDVNKSDDLKLPLLKKVINIFDALELSLIYDVKDNSGMVTQNIVDNIIFEKKNIQYTKYLIDKYSYLIKNYNLESDVKLFDKIIKKYIECLNLYVKNDDKSDLYYYNDVLEEMFSSEKIRHLDFDKIKELDIIKKFFEREDLDPKARQKNLLWLNHLYNLISSSNYVPGVVTLNNLYDIRYYFKDSVLDEANLYSAVNNPSYDMSKKVVSDYTITIDEDGTIDKDDAISVTKLNDEIYRLKIFIADPNSFCGMNSLLMNEAKKRSQTIYLDDDETIFMFPFEVITNNLSLDENKYRYVRCYQYDIDTNGEVVDFKITKDILNVSKNLSYDKVNEIIFSSCDDLELLKTLENLFDLRNILIKNNSYLKNRNSSKISSQIIIDFFMSFNNRMVASYFKKNNLPMIYRKHRMYSDLDQCGIDFSSLSIEERKKYGKIIERIENVSLSAFYCSDLDSKHDSLKLDCYTHSNSPVRRYADILVNNCEDNFYFNKLSDTDAYLFEDSLKDDILFLNKRNEEIMRYYQKRCRLLKRD